MFWNKKEEKQLPDLPPIRSPFSKDIIPVKPNANPSPESQPSPVIKETETNESHETESEEGEIEKHSLPSFPDSPIAKGFSQAAIKDAINQDEIKEEPADVPPKIPEKTINVTDKKFKTIEMDEPEGENSKKNPFLSSMNAQIEKNRKERKIPSYTPSYSKDDSFSLGLPPVEKEEMEREMNRNEEEAPITKIQPQKGDIFVKIDKFFSAKKALDSIDDQVNEIDALLNKIRETKLKEEKELANWEKQITLIKSRIQNINDNIFEKTQ